MRAATDGARERNRALFDGAFGRVYSFYTERERLSRLIAAAAWGGDIRPFYASMGAIGEIPDGGVIVDAPCGAGVALRGLRPEQRIRYLALDLSPRMLERVHRRAGELRLRQVELIEGDAQSVPIHDSGADLFLSYWGLHCFPAPAEAVAELARCLRPGGRVIGSMITHGSSLRHRLLVRPGRGGFGPGGTAQDLRRWLADSALGNAIVEESGPFAYFQARRTG